MIWASTRVMIAIDLFIFILIVVILAVSSRYGEFRKGRMPRSGRLLAMSGVGLIGIFYLLDLLALLVLPRYVGAERAMQTMIYLHVEVVWFITVIALMLIGIGLLLTARQRHRIEKDIARNEHRVAIAEKEIVRSEIRFRSLMEQTPDAVYCLELTPGVPTSLPFAEQLHRLNSAVLVECNKAFADELGVSSPAVGLGLRFDEFDSVKHAESHVPFIQCFIDNDYRLKDYDLYYESPDGEQRSLQISLTGVVQKGELVRIWGAAIDTLEQMQTRKALFERVRFEEFLLAMSSRLIKSKEAELSDLLSRCLGHTCLYMDCDRATITWLSEAQQRAEALFFWNEHGGPPRVAASLENYPWLAARLLDGETVAISNTSDMPPEAATDAENLRRGGLTTFIAVPLAISNEVLGVLALGSLSGSREWKEQEVTDLRVLADLFVNVVNRILTRQSLDEVLEELGVAKERLEAENVYLQQEIRSTHGFDEIVGESPQLNRCLRQVEMVADTSTAVLIQGDTGTGKELIARAVHERSARNDRPLVKVNCAALPPNLIESELFGHEKGAFTGAITAKRGRFDLADNGTLFLDEIGDFPLELQGKLLRVVQEGEFQRLGGTETIKVDVRLIAATNRNLREAVDSGEFRADLFYRINTYPIYLPRLSERVGDVPILAEYFVAKHAALLGQEITAISAAMMEMLNSYHWPGNVRELEGLIQRAIISASGPILDASGTLIGEKDKLAAIDAESGSPHVDLRYAERSHIEKILAEAEWVIGGTGGAAARLGIPPSTLRSKMKKLGIGRPGQPN